MRGMMGGQEAGFERHPKVARQRPQGDGAFYGLLAKCVAGGAAACISAVLLLSPGRPASIGSQAFALAPLPNLRTVQGFSVEGLSDAGMRGQVTVVNVFATWCGPCREEHGALLNFASERRVRIVGLLSSDSAANGAAYLKERGNPFSAVSADTIGLARRLGATGYPTTLVLDGEGKVRASLRGSLDAERIRTELLPAIERARNG